MKSKFLLFLFDVLYGTPHDAAVKWKVRRGPQAAVVDAVGARTTCVFM